MLNKLVISFLLLFYFGSAYAEEEFKVKLESSGPYALLTFELAPGAKLYWRHPGEVGLPTKFKFNNSDNLAEAEVLWPLPALYTDHDLSSYVYETRVEFPIKILAKDNTKVVDLKLQVNFTICDKACSNHDIDLTVEVDSNSDVSQKILESLSKVPRNNQDISIQYLEQKIIDKEHWLLFKIKSQASLKNPKVFIDLPEYASFDPRKDIIENLYVEGKNEYLLKIPYFLKGKQSLDYAYLNLSTEDSMAIEYEVIIDNKPSHSLTLILLYALIGGLVLNIMPCVLPILALKILQIAKLSGKDSKIIKYDFLAQAAGIVVSFIILALITYFLKAIGMQVGFGMHFQQPIYVITMVIILCMIAMNLLKENQFHLPIPQFIIKVFPTEKRGIIGFFFAGILSTLLAIPCTAPFVTIAIGFALTTEFIKMLAIFSCMGLGMALPYLALAITPGFVKLLPTPGAWMNKFKKLLGIMILVTSYWMIYIIYTQMGFKAALTLFLLVILLKFILVESLLGKKLKLVVFIILVSLCYFVPHHLYEEKIQEEVIIRDTWREYNPSEITKLINKNHVVVLDVTASWCSACSINKLTTLDNIVVMDFIKKNNIIGMRADISKSSSMQVSTLMKMHKHYGIPLNIVYSKKFPQGIVLPTILWPSILISAIKKAE
jgi:suppressor for copper-sensitivity B